MKEQVVFIAPDGTLTFIHDDGLMSLVGESGKVTVTRASHVEPTADGRHWTADMSPILGRELILGPFPTRAEALEAEQAWLIDYLRRGADEKGNL